MMLEISDRNPITAIDTTWQICLQGKLLEPQVEIYEVRQNQRRFVACYGLTSLLAGGPRIPLYLDATRPSHSLSCEAFRQLCGWLHSTGSTALH